MPKRLLQILLLATIALFACRTASGAETASPPRIEQEMWALPFPLPVLAYVVRPLGDGPFPLVIADRTVKNSTLGKSTKFGQLHLDITAPIDDDTALA